MQSATRLTLLLCAAWTAALLYGEMGAYWEAHLSCSWPSASSSSPSLNNHVKIAVIADPQLMDSTSLGLPASSIVLQAVEFFTDLNMRRSFQSVILPFKPDVILFLGDHFDGGPYMSDEEWQESLFRFKHIFSMSGQRTNPHVPVYYLSGNHDIGYSAFHSPKVIDYDCFFLSFLMTSVCIFTSSSNFNSLFCTPVYQKKKMLPQMSCLPSLAKNSLPPCSPIRFSEVKSPRNI